ncbi:hypothetical protein AC3_A0118 [Clostridium perfringens E str. JGS1987]|uniref:Uncharacterized protein n=1 Tax=Clostridium perfringens E str. JGS1987 TaxID=451755 RepID=B1BQZ0_CLOPF|nr:hypothetical protein AC3_A0118 [Clostridium perfringens E str. JGS1987]
MEEIFILEKDINNILNNINTIIENTYKELEDFELLISK